MTGLLAWMILFLATAPGILIGAGLGSSSATWLDRQYRLRPERAIRRREVAGRVSLWTGVGLLPLWIPTYILAARGGLF